MVEKILADASPEKRLFISLITRDISLAEALLDLIDNSINAALEPYASRLKTADDYQKLLNDEKVEPKVWIYLTINESDISITDNAPGISIGTARDHVFKFGRESGETEKTDRLSVYGIGLKRAIFKCGNKISISSDHRDGGFELDLNVKEWAKKREMPWTFEIEPTPPMKEDCGTQIVISDLHDDVQRRISDGVFIDELRDRIARTYAFFIGRVVDIYVNDQQIEKESFEIGDNYTSEKFRSGKVSCNITAGIAAPTGDRFRDRNAGWFVFCNGRAVLFADKTSLTGWSGAGLPIFQPKHRPFLGTVFFVSADPEALPWTTTKASVNQESSVWQEAKRQMVVVGRVVVGFLDKRYTDDGTEIAPSELQSAAGNRINVFAVSTSKKKVFQPPKPPANRSIKIQYDAKTSDVKKIASYLRRPGMSGSEVGRFTFEYFLKNEVGGDE